MKLHSVTALWRICTQQSPLPFLELHNAVWGIILSLPCTFLIVCSRQNETKVNIFILPQGLSLTVLLVMYTLYQGVSLSISQTAYIKMIDWWLLFCLIVPFAVFIIEIYWQHKHLNLMHADSKNNRWVDRKNREVATKPFKKDGICIIPILTIVFTMIYIIIAIVLYNSPL